ncbi:MAG: M20/M25/M40 family metallo-hydrolase [Spirochaetales bacterium]
MNISGFTRSITNFFKRVFRHRFRVTGKPLIKSGKYSPLVTRILTDAMLFNEVPSSPEQDSPRVEFILRKLNDFGISESYQDEFGNVAVVIPAGSYSEKYVLLYTDIGTEQYSPLESLVRLSETRATGMGIADESLGVATLLTFIEQIHSRSIVFPHNVVCLFTHLSEEEREFLGLEHFLKNFPGSFQFAVYVTSIHQGIFEPKPLGQCKLVVRITTPEAGVLERPGIASSVNVLSNIAFQLGAIQWDKENETIFNLAKIDAGVGFGYYPSEGVLELEMFSMNPLVLDMMKNTAIGTIERISQEAGAKVEIKIISHVPVGDPTLNVELQQILKEVYGKLKIEERALAAPTKTAFINSYGIPAVTLGIAKGRKGKREEFIEIEPIEKGFHQLELFLQLGMEAMELKEE